MRAAVKADTAATRTGLAEIAGDRLNARRRTADAPRLQPGDHSLQTEQAPAVAIETSEDHAPVVLATVSEGEAARGRKAGAFLLKAIIAKAEALGAETL